ncbi:hypothetical protein GFC01_12990 [Desulfofundulus thermobenzoicus]|uniref:Uncharacterized protein n=1 Tax=Desulfofundulus thermobenzoicus TaxID=29376 RepID=A0A6N7ISP9_9FIRM|nr:hypothetical protein [Desulfofundulus thermobenzoicus]MQL53155.1 hypothetical protein [Desulfofundulus thermobenzoicus]HHW44794.1 hypothetical protein [Desulfotomaculum sp.]
MRSCHPDMNLSALLSQVQNELMGRDGRITRIAPRKPPGERLYLEVYLRDAGSPECRLPLALSTRYVREGDVSSLVSQILWAAEHGSRVELVEPLESTRSFRVTA